MDLTPVVHSGPQAAETLRHANQHGRFSTCLTPSSTYHPHPWSTCLILHRASSPVSSKRGGVLQAYIAKTAHYSWLDKLLATCRLQCRSLGEERNRQAHEAVPLTMSSRHRKIRQYMQCSQGGHREASKDGWKLGVIYLGPKVFVRSRALPSPL